MKSLALARPVFATNEQYLEAAHDLAQARRQQLAQLLAHGDDPELTASFASVIVQTWGVEHDALWERRLAGVPDAG